MQKNLTVEIKVIFFSTFLRLFSLLTNKLPHTSSSSSKFNSEIPTSNGNTYDIERYFNRAASDELKYKLIINKWTSYETYEFHKIGKRNLQFLDQLV